MPNAMDPSLNSLHECLEEKLSLNHEPKAEEPLKCYVTNLSSEHTTTTDAFQGVAPPSSSATSRYSSALQQEHYDVFVSHRGPDVKEILAIPIHHVLSRSHGLEVFVDTEELQVGDLFSAAIQKAIRTSSVLVAIFSPNFASSPWCLAELSYMLKMKAKHNAQLIPVYYNVRQSDLQDVDKGVFKKAFAQYEEKGRYPKMLVEEWKAALHQASFHYALDSQEAEFHGNNVNLIQGIVDIVIQHIRKIPLEVAAHPVGIDSAVEDFENFTNVKEEEHQHEEATVVGIVGMGGSGKTTLAKELFNRKQQFFSRSSFIFDVREVTEKNGFPILQRKLLKDLVKINDLIYSSEEGKAALRKHLRGLRVLIVLDDISDKSQLDNLLLKDVLDCESCIIVTSRDKAVLQHSQVRVVYDIKKLNEDHAEELFCRHAFLQQNPIQKFEYLVRKFVKLCDGLPLSIKIVAGNLLGKFTMDQWEMELQKFSKELNLGISKVLSISYYSLEEFERQVFLDIACFFYDETRDLVLKIWDDWRGWLGLQILENKCLLEFDEKNSIKMHDHLRDFGRATAKLQSPLRIWKADAINNLEVEDQGSVEIQGIMAANGPHLGGTCSSSYPPPFREIEERLKPTKKSVDMKLLVISGPNCFRRKFSKNVTKSLRWLRWYDCPLTSIPEWLCMENLRVLEILASYHGHIKELWSSPDKVPLQLRELSITNSKITSLPKTIELMTFLEKLFIEGDMKIKALPEEVCSLKCLKQIKLRHCYNLVSLPNGIGNLQYLEHLDLIGCKRLKSLPKSFSKLKRLCYLDLCACRALKIQQDIFKEITTLEYLNFHHCKKLRELPLETTCQAHLRTLDLRDTSVVKLPNGLWKLKDLEILKIGSPFLTLMPSFYKHLTKLKELSIEGCRSLEYIQDSIETFTSLTKLKVEKSGVLCFPIGIEALTRLESLEISECPIPQIKFISTCRNSDAEPNPKKPRLEISQKKPMCFLKELVLRETDIQSSISIKEEDFPNLKEIDISCNKELEEITSLPRGLRKISLEKCSKLHKVDGITNLTKLRTLDISGCHALEELPSLHQFTMLESLCTDDCWKFRELKGIEFLSRLSKLRLKNCYQLENLSSLKNLKSLSVIDISGCHKLKIVEGLEELESLDTFEAGECWELKCIQGLQYRRNLRFLELPVNKEVICNYIPYIKVMPEVVFIQGRPVPDAISSLESLNVEEQDMSEADGVTYFQSDESNWQLIFVPVSSKEEIWTNAVIVVFVALGNLYVTVFSACSNTVNEINFNHSIGDEFGIDKSQWLGSVDGVKHWSDIEKAWILTVKKGQEFQKWEILVSRILSAFATWELNAMES